MIKQLALIWGVIFTLIGILGFIPGIAPEHSDGMRYLLGLFMVGAVHNIIHLATGLASLASSTSETYARRYFQVFGIVYALVTIIGFVQGNTVLGIFDVNMADNFLHVAITVAALAIGFGVPTRRQQAASA